MTRISRIHTDRNLFSIFVYLFNTSVKISVIPVWLAQPDRRVNRVLFVIKLRSAK